MERLKYAPIGKVRTKFRSSSCVLKRETTVHSNVLVQNHVNYNMLSKKITLWGGGAMVKNFILQCRGEEFKSLHLQPRLPWLLR